MSTNLVDVRMPDGTIIKDIPEGTTQSEIIRRYSTATRPPAGEPLNTSMKQSAVGAIPSFAEGLGIDPQHPITGTIKNAASGIAALPELLTKPSQLVPAVGTALTEGPKNLYGGIQSSDYNQTALGMGQTLSRDVPLLAGAVKGVASVLTPEVSAASGDIAAIRNIERLQPASKEAAASAGRIAAEALQRGSIPESRNINIVDHKIFRNLANAEVELKAAKQSVPAGQVLPAKPLLDKLDNATSKYQIEGPVRSQWGMDTRTAAGDPYTPLSSTTQQVAESGRSSNIGSVRNRVADLVNDKGQIRGDKLQSLKELIDKEIYDHSGWNDTGTAADKANLAALREANRYVREALDSLGNEQLNQANANYSHQAELAKIVESRRADLLGLSSSEAKAARALTPLTSRQSTAGQFVRATAKKYGGPMIGGAVAEELIRRQLGSR